MGAHLSNIWYVSCTVMDRIGWDGIGGNSNKRDAVDYTAAFEWRSCCNITRERSTCFEESVCAVPWLVERRRRSRSRSRSRSRRMVTIDSNEYNEHTHALAKKDTAWKTRFWLGDFDQSDQPKQKRMEGMKSWRRTFQNDVSGISKFQIWACTLKWSNAALLVPEAKLPRSSIQHRAYFVERSVSDAILDWASEITRKEGWKVYRAKLCLLAFAHGHSLSSMLQLRRGRKIPIHRPWMLDAGCGMLDAGCFYNMLAQLKTCSIAQHDTQMHPPIV